MSPVGMRIGYVPTIIKMRYGSRPSKADQNSPIRHFNQVELEGGTTIVDLIEGGLCQRYADGTNEKHREQGSLHGSVNDQFLRLSVHTVRQFNGICPRSQAP